MYQFSSHLPPYPSFSHSTAVFSFWAVYLHTHTHVPSHSPPRRFLRLCLPPSDAGTDNICSNPLSSSYFLYSSSPASCLLFIHFVHQSTTVSLCFIQDRLPLSLIFKFKTQFGLCLFLGSCVIVSSVCVSLLSHLTDCYLYSVSVRTRHSCSLPSTLHASLLQYSLQFE